MRAYLKDSQHIELKFQGDHQSQCRELAKIRDRRIHLLLFFFDGHHTKDQDFLAIKEFQSLTNVIPLLAKGDSFERAELKKVKENIVEMGRK